MSYENLSDDDKVILAIGFVARGTAIPHQLEAWLVEAGLYDVITNPEQIDVKRCNQGSSR